jgi:hypothetical protein
MLMMLDCTFVGEGQNIGAKLHSVLILASLKELDAFITYASVYYIIFIFFG